MALAVNAASFLFDATKAETVANADWVVDEDNHITGRFPTPDAAGITTATPETYWTGALSSWGIALVQLGNTVESLPINGRLTYLDSTNPQDLSHYQIYVVCEPNIRFTTAEKTALIRYVQDGGSLFIISDHAGSDRNNDGADSVAIWNDFFTNNGVQSNPFGVSINSNSISLTSIQADNAADDPLTNGPVGIVSQLKYSAGATLTINSLANSSVRAAFWSNSARADTNVMVAYGKFGAGRFVVVGDSSPSDDGTGSPGHTLYYGWTDVGGNHSRLVLNASLWLASADTGSGPFNDTFDNAFKLDPGSFFAAGGNVGATKEPGEPNHAGDAGGTSVWWQFTAVNSGTMTLYTDSSSFSNLLAVYTGNNVASLSLVAETVNGTVSFQVIAGVNYHISVDGLSGATGQIYLDLVSPGPANDFFNEAEQISSIGRSITYSGNNFNATSETGEPRHADPSSGRSVWWRWTSNANGPVIISTVGSNFNTLLAIYTGNSVNNLTSIVSNANYGSLQQSQVTLQAVAGTTYQIAVAGYYGVAGNISLTLSPGTSTTAPSNDNFANASLLPGSTVSATATTTYATLEPGEPANANITGAHSVWWRWTAPGDGIVTVNTKGSNFDTTLGVYRGAAVNGLSAIVSDDDSGGNLTSLISFLVRADMAYSISVDGYGSAAGNTTLNLSFTQGNNDNFSSATVLSGSSVDISSVNMNASLENGESTFLNGSHSVWYKWTAPSDLVVTVSTINSLFNTTVAVYTGESVEGLTYASFYETRNDYNSGSKSAIFNARSQVVYYFRIDGLNGEMGSIALSLIGLPVPVITLSATPGAIAEKNSQTSVLTLSLNTTSLLPITLPLNFGGIAILGVDYNLSLPTNPNSSTLTIPAGTISGSINVSALPDNDPTESDETISISTTAGVGYALNPSATSVNLTILDDSPYTFAWETLYRPLGFSGNIANPVFDADGDGLSNFMEFALNLNPLSGHSSANLPTLGIISLIDPADGSVHRYPTITFVERTDAPYLIYTVEGTSNLGGNDWNAVNAVFISSGTEGAAPNTNRFIYRSARPLDEAGALPRQFLRLRVTNTGR